MQTSALLISRRIAGTTLKLGKGMTGRPLEGAGGGRGDGSGTGFTAGSEEGRIKAGADEAGGGRTAGVEGRLGGGATTGLRDDAAGGGDAGAGAGAAAGLKIWNRTNRLSAPQH